MSHCIRQKPYKCNNKSKEIFYTTYPGHCPRQCYQPLIVANTLQPQNSINSHKHIISPVPHENNRQSDHNDEIHRTPAVKLSPASVNYPRDSKPTSHTPNSLAGTSTLETHIQSRAIPLALCIFHI